MADLKPFIGVSQDDTLQTCLFLLGMIAEKLPRVDNQDRQIVTLAESSGGAITSVTTVTNLTNLLNLGLFAGANSANAAPLHFANIGAQHLYQQIIVS